MTSKFKYRERSPETVQSRAKQQGGDFDNYLSGQTPTLKVKEGEITLRILPPTWDFKKWGDNWGVEVWAHGDVGADHGAFLCPKKMAEKYPHLLKEGILKSDECCVCDAREEEEDAEVQKKMRAGKRIVALVIDRDQEKLGPQVWNLGWQLEKEIQIRSQDKKSGDILAIDHPDEGYDITFTREGQKLKTRYVGVDIAREPSPISDRATRQVQWLESISKTPLVDQLIFHDNDYISDVFNSKAPAREREEKDRKGSKGKRAKSQEALISQADLDDMEEDELKEVIEDNKLDIDPDDFPREAGLRKAVAKALDEEGLLKKDEDEEEEPERKPSGKTTRKVPAKKAKEKLTEAQLDDMDASELAEIVENYKLEDVDPDDYPKEAGLRRAVIKALEEADLLEEEEADDPEPRAGKSTRKTPAKGKTKEPEKVKEADLDDMDMDGLQQVAKDNDLDDDVIDEDSERRTRKNIIAALKEKDLLEEDEEPPFDKAGAESPAERAKRKLQRLKPKE